MGDSFMFMMHYPSKPFLFTFLSLKGESKTPDSVLDLLGFDRLRGNFLTLNDFFCSSGVASCPKVFSFRRLLLDDIKNYINSKGE